MERSEGKGFGLSVGLVRVDFRRKWVDLDRAL